jgi:hypothetical protein
MLIETFICCATKSLDRLIADPGQVFLALMGRPCSLDSVCLVDAGETTPLIPPLSYSGHIK